jgi:hypothetical protein
MGVGPVLVRSLGMGSLVVMALTLGPGEASPDGDVRDAEPYLLRQSARRLRAAVGANLSGVDALAHDSKRGSRAQEFARGARRDSGSLESARKARLSAEPVVLTQGNSSVHVEHRV